jgi:hypothetical protein
MTGEDRATLQGFAIPLAPAMDHTYVASSCGLRWGCFGRDDNGAMICTGSESSRLANCLSQVDSRAGIIYGITGVCHQAANRILYPARLTVSLAGGFRHSVFVFGLYGSGWPEKLSGCLSPPGGGDRPPNASGGEGSSSEPKSPSSPTTTRLPNFNKSVAMTHDPSPKDEKDRTAELAALVKLGLGKPLDDRTFGELALIQADMRNEQLKLQQRLIGREISPDEYLQLFHSAEVLEMMRCERLLGPEAFSKIFGKDGLAPLIDRKTFLEEHRLR